MDSRDDSFLDDLEDEFVWGRLLAVDPALPECLGGTVISPWQDAHMVREVEHAVKSNRRVSLLQAPKTAFQKPFDLQKFT